MKRGITSLVAFFTESTTGNEKSISYLYFSFFMDVLFFTNPL